MHSFWCYLCIMCLSELLLLQRSNQIMQTNIYWAMEYRRWITQLTCKLDLKGSEQQITEMCVFVCLCTLVAVLSIMRCGVMYIIVKRVCFVIVLLRESILDACDLQVLRGPALKTGMILSLHVCELTMPSTNATLSCNEEAKQKPELKACFKMTREKMKTVLESDKSKR